MKEVASRNSKRKIVPTPFVGRKLRSTRSRRERAQISPAEVSAHSIDSCGSSRVEKNSNVKKKRIEDVKETTIGDPEFRRITRSYSKLIKETKGEEIEVSESSCVESYSGVGLNVERNDEVNGLGINENDEISVTRSDVTFVDRVSNCRSLNLASENKESDVVSGVEYCSKFGTVTGGGADNEEIESSKPEAELSLGLGCVSDLACSEKFSDDDVVSDSYEDESSEVFSHDSEFDFSDYTPSMFFDSGSQFSEKSSSDSPTSLARSLFLEFKEQFSRSTIPNDLESVLQEDNREFQSQHLRFEDEEVEESYQRLRERERSHSYLRVYAKDYCSRMDHTDFMPRLRSSMVQWIVEQCSALELQQETLFLGVSLLDRFLSKGSFKSERTLILVGIASLTLATRIEENQPYNSIRQRNFYIQNLKYNRSEVVAMEWLVLEVLNFKCFSPTIFNFLWFYLKAARANPVVEKKAKSLAVTSLSDHTQLCFWPSTVAASVVVLASIKCNKTSAYERVIKVHVRTDDNDFSKCVKSLEWMLGQ